LTHALLLLMTMLLEKSSITQFIKKSLFFL
jgi:hypothetical protein